MARKTDKREKRKTGLVGMKACACYSNWDPCHYGFTRWHFHFDPWC
jgi:hypothetical protein